MVASSFGWSSAWMFLGEGTGSEDVSIRSLEVEREHLWSWVEETWVLGM